MQYEPLLCGVIIMIYLTECGRKFQLLKEKKPKEYTPLIVNTFENEVLDVIMIDNGFDIEFINEVDKIFLGKEEVKGWWYH